MQAILMLLSAFFYFLPVVTIASLPYIGTMVSSVLSTAITTWNALLGTIPYLNYSWHVFLVVILPFELLLLLGKFFLGSRMPVHG